MTKLAIFETNFAMICKNRGVLIFSSGINHKVIKHVSIYILRCPSHNKLVLRSGACSESIMSNSQLQWIGLQNYLDYLPKVHTRRY